jgi:anti-anti-sigma factor
MDLLDRPNGPPEPIELRPHSAASVSAEVIVHVVGEIDICTEPALARCLAAHLQPTRLLTSLVVDMSSVTYIGVQGIAALLTAATNAQHRDVAFSVANCSPSVLQVLAVIDPAHTLTVRADSGRAGRPRSSAAPEPGTLGDQEPAGEAVIPPMMATG